MGASGVDEVCQRKVGRWIWGKVCLWWLGVGLRIGVFILACPHRLCCAADTSPWGCPIELRALLPLTMTIHRRPGGKFPLDCWWRCRWRCRIQCLTLLPHCFLLEMVLIGGLWLACEEGRVSGRFCGSPLDGCGVWSYWFWWKKVWTSRYANQDSWIWILCGDGPSEPRVCLLALRLQGWRCSRASAAILLAAGCGGRRWIYGWRLLRTSGYQQQLSKPGRHIHRGSRWSSAIACRSEVSCSWWFSHSGREVQRLASRRWRCGSWPCCLGIHAPPGCKLPSTRLFLCPQSCTAAPTQNFQILGRRRRSQSVHWTEVQLLGGRNGVYYRWRVTSCGIHAQRE